VRGSSAIVARYLSRQVLAISSMFDASTDRARPRPRNRDLHFSTKSGSCYCSAELAESKRSSLFATQATRASFSAEADSSSPTAVRYIARSSRSRNEKERASFGGEYRNDVPRRAVSSAASPFSLPPSPLSSSSRSFYSGDPPLEARMETTVIEINISFWKGRAPFAW